MFEDEVEEEAGGGSTTWWEDLDLDLDVDGESEGEEAANAGSGREWVGGGEAVSSHGRLHNAFEVAS